MVVPRRGSFLTDSDARTRALREMPTWWCWIRITRSIMTMSRNSG